MTYRYDLVVVGAGTAGLEAAKTAAAAGLRVAVVERKSDPAKIQRSCAQMFLMNMDSFYNEHMYFSREKAKWIFPANNFSVDYPGSYREFYALHFIAPNAIDRIEVGDYEANAGGAGTPAVVFDKGMLLGGLFKACLKEKVDFFLNHNVIDARKIKQGVAVKTYEGETIHGTFCIAADGINSRLARNLGLNKERIFINTGKANSYYITGVSFERSEMIALGICCDRGSLGTIMFCMLPSVYRDNEYWLYIVGKERFKYLTQKSPFRRWFHNVTITHERCAVVSNWSPAREPFKDNVIFAGDSCWFAEAENTGALLSGHKAALAVCSALHTGRVNREGILEYIQWWRRNWPETHDYREFLCYPLFNRLFTEDEYNYIHHIASQKLPWTLNPFKLYGNLMQGLTPHLDKIREERPEIAKKIARFRPEAAVNMMRPATRAGFPCY